MSSSIGDVAEREECVIEWTVRDFLSLPAKVDELYLSPSFSFDGERWCLAVYPNGRKEKNSEGYITIGLVRFFDLPIELNFSLGLKTSKNKIAEERHGPYKFDEKERSCGWSRFLRRSELVERQSELAPSGHLTWVCCLKHHLSTDAASAIPTAKCAHCKETVDAGSLPSHERKCLDKPIQCPECSEVVALKHWYAHECQPAKSKGGSSASGALLTNKILEDFKQLFLNQQSCDVILRVQGREFQAHRSILIARSPVFASLFQNDTKEKATAVVDIEDCSPSIFSDFLCFLYCQELDRLSEENVSSLLAAADKFGVSDLRTKCLEFMKEKFNVNILDDTVAPSHSETEPIQLAAA